jgi:uncharacterized repeat protein (TIGR01451 family)
LPGAALGNGATGLDTPLLQTTSVITKEVDKTGAGPGETLSYTITAEFPSSDLLSNVTVTDTVPNGTSFLSVGQGGTHDGGTPGVVTWDLGSNTPGIDGFRAAIPYSVEILDTSLSLSDDSDGQDAFNPAIALDGGDVAHVVFEDKTGDNERNVYYVNNSGGTFGTPTRISDDSDGQDALNPAIALDGSGVVHVVFEDSSGTDTKRNIYYVNNSGGTFGTPTRISDDSDGQDALDPAIALDGSGVAHVVFEDKTGDNRINIYYVNNSGGTFGTPTRISDDSDGQDALNPAIALDGSGVAHVVFEDKTGDNERNVYYVNNSGGTFGTPTRISDDSDGQDALNPAIALDGSGVVHVVYEDRSGTDTKRNIYYVNDSGGTFGTPTRISDDSDGQDALNPAIALDGSGVAHVVFEDKTGDIRRNIYYVNNSGGTFGTPTRISDDSDSQDALNPVIAIGGSKIGAAFEDKTGDNRRNVYHTETDITFPSPATGTSLGAEPTLVASGDLITVTMVLTASEDVANVSPSALTITGTNGVSASLISGPTPISASVGATGTAFTWVYQTSDIGDIGQLVFGGDASDGETEWPWGQSSSIIVAPPLTFQVTVDDPPTVGVVRNTAYLEDDSVIPLTASNATGTSLPADLSIGKVGAPASAAPGQTLTYTLTYTNQGPSPAVDAVISDLVPITVTNVTYTSGGAVITPTGSLSYTWQVIDLASGAGGIITITGVVSPDLVSDTIFNNPATITATTVDTDTTNSSATVTTTVNLPRVSFSSGDYDVFEGGGPAVITAALDSIAYVTVTVDYATSDGSATGANDYTAVSGTLTFTPGVTLVTFSVPITDDGLDEPDETVQLTLSNPTRAILEVPSAATLNILEPREIDVQGNGLSISDGDTTPSLANHTEFGQVLISSGAVTRTFTISNTGSLALTLTGSPAVTITGPHAADFNVTSQPGSPVGPDGSASFQVSFDPSATGTRSATISILNDDGDENPYTFAVQGTGIAPEISVAPPSLAFGDQDIDAGATLSQTVVITNDGTADLTISSVSLVSAHFSIEDDSGEGVLSPGATRTVQVSFSPTSIGLKNANLRIQSDDTDEDTVDVALSGTGVDQEITVAPLSLAFGDQDVDAGATLSQTVVITNDGTADLTITGVGLVGADSSHFNIEADSGEGVLTPGGSRTVQVSFNPTSVGAKSANLRIQSDDGDEPTVDVALSGTGTDTEQPTVNFTVASQSACEDVGTLTITAQLNTVSGQDVSLPYSPSGTASEGADYTINPSPLVIAAGSLSATVTITISDDILEETDETIIVTMGTPVNASRGISDTHTVTIIDNDISFRACLPLVLKSAP